MTDSLREHVRACLERNSALCLDVQSERDRVIDAVCRAVRRTPEAVMIRQAFANAGTAGKRIIVMRAIGGRREGDLLDAMAALAGCEREPFAEVPTQPEVPTRALVLDSPDADPFQDLGDGEG